MSIISQTSPSASARIFPVSSEMRAPSSFFFSRSASPMRRTSSPRRGAGTVRHARNAECAAATAWSKSSGDAWRTERIGVPVAGLTEVSSPPRGFATHSPAYTPLGVPERPSASKIGCMAPL